MTTTTTTTPTSETEKRVEAILEKALAKLDVEALAKRFHEQDEFIVLDRFLPPELLEGWNTELDGLIPLIHRNYIPRHKKGGSVVYDTVAERAPSIDALYRSPAFNAFLKRLFGAQVFPCPTRDPHSCAVYAYTEAGDHMGFHYDNSYYKGRRFTVLFGIRDASTSKLVCHLYTRARGREKEVLEVRTEPGMFVAFDGARLLHSVSPLGENEHRFVASMQYIESAAMNPFLRFVSDMKDAIAYFGFRQVFRRKKAPAPKA